MSIGNTMDINFSLFVPNSIVSVSLHNCIHIFVHGVFPSVNIILIII